METVKEQQAIALEVLRVTQSIMNDAIIAGGAPRNWYQNKLAYDVDIYLWQDKQGRLDRVALKLGINPDDLREKKCSPDSDYVTDQITEVWEVDYKDQIIQWIFLREKGVQFQTLEEFVIETFDFNICKCFFNESGDVLLTKEAKEDFDNQTLTIDIFQMQKYRRIERLPKRSRKLQEYYPNHKIVIAGNRVDSINVDEPRTTTTIIDQLNRLGF